MLVMRLRRKLLSVLAVVAVFVGGTPPVKAAGEHDCCERSFLKLAAERSGGAPVRSFGAGDLADPGCHMDHTGVRGDVSVALPPPQIAKFIAIYLPQVREVESRRFVAATGPPIYIVQLSLLV